MAGAFSCKQYDSIRAEQGIKHQIGLSGRTVKPKLLICIGVSGAVQTVAGMKGSECIIAINKDPDAPIHDNLQPFLTEDRELKQEYMNYER